MRSAPASFTARAFTTRLAHVGCEILCFLGGHFDVDNFLAEDTLLKFVNCMRRNSTNRTRQGKRILILFAGSRP